MSRTPFDQGCAFCQIARTGQDLNGVQPVGFERLRAGVMFEPRDPHVVGHRLFVPFTHVETAACRPAVTGQVALLMAEYAQELEEEGLDCNLVFNCGPGAGQTILHLHGHVLPRQPGADGVLMPWDHTTGCQCLCTGVPPLTREQSDAVRGAST
ncbi:HIT family protein [Nocardiopsis terrae]|uniref:HIT family protein n=1 Tax=Streptomyces sp. NPDC057554 TaxID=3350538 RepID=UPI0036C55334